MTYSVVKQQRGMSGIVLIIVLAIIAGAVFFGMQYIPQYMEAGTVDSILASIKKAADTGEATNKGEVESMLAKRLQVNNMLDMQDAFEVTEKDGDVIVSVKFERELNLLYEKRPVKYSKTLVLKMK